MRDKNLPIRLFNKRKEYDERLVEGGGSQSSPKWILEGDQLSERVQTLLEDISSSKITIERQLENYKGVPAIIKAKMNEDSLAKSHRKEITELLESEKIDRFIGISGNDDILIKVESSKQLEKIQNNISEATNKKAISAIEHIQPNSVSIDLDSFERSNEKYLIKLRLINYLDDQTNEQALFYLKELIQSVDNISLTKSVKYSDSLMIHQLETTTLDSLQKISEFNSVLSIESMPTIEIVEDDFFEHFEGGLPIPSESEEYQIVGILDSGISINSPLVDWTVPYRHTNYPPHYINPSHGSFVAGIVNFGDRLEGSIWTGNNNFLLYDGAIFPNQVYETVSESDLVDNIREAVEKSIDYYGDAIKIWNLSIGTRIESDIDSFSDFGIALDSIQDEYNILFIKSAGNCKNFMDGNPVSRIANGADSIRAITVGSIAHSKQTADLVNENERSPFSRIGPGPAQIVKPDLVHYGGNHSGVKNGLNGITSLSVDGKLSKNIGTSFSTPRVTALAANLNGELGGDFDPLLIKGLLIHSAKYPENNELVASEALKEIGFGVPQKAEDILYNNSYDSTLIIRDTLRKGEFIEILDFPFPENLVDDEGFFYGQVTVTLVSSPILKAGQGSEYCQSNLKVSFGTYDERKPRDTSKPTIRNPIGMKNNQNLLITDIYTSKKSPEKNEFARTEKMLVKYGDKFHPNKKYVVDLTELTPGNKQKLMKHPKKWFLKIEGLFRDFVERRSEIENIELAQEFCVLITIKDPLKEKNVYEEVFQKLEEHNFIHQDIIVKTEITVDANLDL